MIRLEVIAPSARGILAPRRFSRPLTVGLGSDFESYMGDAQFAASWNAVGNQLGLEGASNLDILAAKNSFANAFDQLTNNSVDATSALNAAQTFVTAGHTVLGAVQHVQGLLAAAGGQDPGTTFQTFTGTMIGLAVAAGALSAGLGAAITVGLGACINLLQAAGFFGSQPQGQEICPGLWINPPPKIQVGCVGTAADTIAAGAGNWRHFPKPSGGHAGDSDWYGYSGSSWWSGSSAGTAHTWTSYPGYRLIDQAFSDYHYLSCQKVPSNLQSFAQAFSAAWIANKEYALNGLKTQDDWQVLVQVARTWNRAHDGSTYVDVPVGVSKPYVPKPYQCPQGALACTSVTGCPPNLPPLFQTLDVFDHISAGGEYADIVPSNSGLRIHTGPIKSPTRHVTIPGFHLGPPKTTTTPPAPSKANTVAKTAAIGAVGVVAAAGIGGTVWALLQKQSVGYFWGKVFDQVVEGGKSLVRRAGV